MSAEGRTNCTAFFLADIRLHLKIKFLILIKLIKVVDLCKTV